MREDILGYLLGALSPAETRRIEQTLRNDPSLRAEVERIRESLDFLGPRCESVAPPAGLAERTCASILGDAPKIAPAVRDSLSGSRNQFRLADLIFACGACLAVVILMLPALLNSHYNARLAQCQNNLRDLGIALIAFSERQTDQQFPEIPLEGPESFAGIVPITLAESQFLASDRPTLVCPSSEQARQAVPWTYVSRPQILQAGPQELAQLQQQAGGTTGFNLGYVDANRYQAARNQGRTHFVIAGDQPSLHLSGRLSGNHGGRGQNYLFEDGHVAFVLGCLTQACDDDPLRNVQGHVEAGLGRDDSVIGASQMRPFIRSVSLD